jgi:hypothetical protein
LQQPRRRPDEHREQPWQQSRPVFQLEQKVVKTPKQLATDRQFATATMHQFAAATMHQFATATGR